MRRKADRQSGYIFRPIDLDGQTERLRDIHLIRLTDREIERYTSNQMDRQTSRWTIPLWANFWRMVLSWRRTVGETS